MSFWKKRKKSREKIPDIQESVAPSKRPSGPKRVLPVEVRLLAIDAREAGLSSKELSEMLGVAPATIDKWMSLYRREGEN